MLRRRGHAFRPGTAANHLSQFRAYFAFCLEYNLRDINPSVDTVCLYVEHLAQRLQSPKSVTNYISGVRLLHKYMGVECPSLQSFELDLMLRALGITMLHVPNQCLPITTTILQQICQVCSALGPLGRVLKCAFLFGFFGLLRQSNLAPKHESSFDPHRHTCRGDVIFHHPGLVIIQKWSKTQQRGGQPHLIPLPTIVGSPLCPVAAYTAMLEIAPTHHRNQPLLCAPGSCEPGQPLTTTWLRQSFAIIMDTLGHDIAQYSLHSLRRGGATTSYQAGVAFTEIQRHGGWKSNAFWDYIAPTSTVYAALPRQLARATCGQ